MTSSIIQKFKCKTQNSDTCPNCYEQLQQLESLKYCYNCKQCPSIMDNSIRQPNYNIKQNIIELKLKGTGKIESHVRDIFCKLNMRASESEANSISQKVLYMHGKRGPNRKGYKQQTAAVIYKQFSDQIRMSIYQFCTKTGISRKKFNKMYTQYQNLLKQTILKEKQKSKRSGQKIQDYFVQQENLNLKQEQIQPYLQKNSHLLSNDQQWQQYQIKQQDSYEKNQNVIQSQINGMLKRYPSFNTQQYQFNAQDERQTMRRTVEKIYDKIFTSLYLSKFKRELINSIVQKSVMVSQLYVESRPLNYLKKYFRIPSILFCVLKMNKYKIGCKKYISLIQSNLDVKITENMINKFTKLCKVAFAQIEDDQEGSSPTTLENRNNQSQRNQTPYSSQDKNQILY